MECQGFAVWGERPANEAGTRQRAAVLKTIADLDKKGRYTNDRVVSSVTFGFWTYLFTKEPYKNGGKTLLKIFPSKTKGLG